MKSYLNFENDIKELESELEKLKDQEINFLAKFGQFHQFYVPG